MQRLDSDDKSKTPKAYKAGQVVVFINPLALVSTAVSRLPEFEPLGR